jgi:hypothetical protein
MRTTAPKETVVRIDRKGAIVMTTNSRIGTAMLAMLCAGLVACTTQEANPNGSGGSSGGGNGGSTTVGSGGSGGGGSTGSAETDGVLCPLPANALITDFTYDDTSTDTSTVHFGDSTTLGGGEFVYPTSGSWPVTSDMTQNNWHIKGTLGDYSGFGLFFDNCNRVDASAYKGISFKISGSVPQGNQITMGIGTLNNIIASSWLLSHDDTSAKEGDPGRCMPTSGTNKYSQSQCADATKVVAVGADPTEVKILWDDFKGGKPDKGVNPSDIVTVYWFFPPPSGAGGTTPTTYDVDITIDDLSFIP